MSQNRHQDMANAIRFLAIDAVEAANSGHPGLPMGAADIATVLFTQFLKFDPAAPDWPDRDRFVLSAGHGSMLLYAVLHLLGYQDMRLEDIKAFRQLGSKTPGHPEYGHTVGVETTTGPLGQGIATAVGMAMAERMLRETFGSKLVDHRTYVLASDGDLMEGLSQEAIALAGHLKLNRMIVLFDDNGICIDGDVSLTDTTDQAARFRAAGWATSAVDGHDPAALARALEQAQESTIPVMIACRTHIGYGAPTRQGSSKAHGSPLGSAEIAATRARLNWPHAPFEIPPDVLKSWRVAGSRHRETRRAWEERLERMDVRQAGAFRRRLEGALPQAFADEALRLRTALAASPQDIATRKASEIVLEAFTAALPEMIGGSADLTSSVNTKTSLMTSVTPEDFTGRFIHYGVREHAMAAAMNGLALHGGFIPYSGTFLVFSDYCRPSLRLAALMGLRVIHVMTHDSIGVGEDGPTHQPVEHLAALRAIPNLNVFRPCDVVETAECWQLALSSMHTPSILALTRQNLPQMRRVPSDDNLCAAGGYELVAASRNVADVSLFASGSEVQLAVEAARQLEAQGLACRVVSVPCLDLLLAQDEAVRTRLIGQSRIKVAIEAGLRMGWDAIIGSDGLFIGMSGFGASGPIQELFRHFGITVEAICREVLARAGKK